MDKHPFREPTILDILISMCGAIKVKLTPQLKAELQKYYTPFEISQFEETGTVIFAFWDKRPLLPFIEENKTHLMDWGNRDKDIELPQTGWARLESLEAGRWNYLHPKVVLIPAIMGYEKKVWVYLPANIRGVVVEKNKTKRVYMITEPATPKYEKLTKHNRMPRLHQEKGST